MLCGIRREHRRARARTNRAEPIRMPPPGLNGTGFGPVDGGEAGLFSAGSIVSVAFLELYWLYVYL